jgi:hypothetical protein
MVKRESSFQTTFPLLQSPIMAVRPWRPISWSFQRTVIVLTLLPEAVWNSVVSVAYKDRRFLRATHFSTQRSHSVSLCGLPLHRWAVVAPRHFHFTITALTVDWGSSSRAQIWWPDLFERWHPMMVPCLKSLCSSVQATLLPMFVYVDFIHLSAMGVAEIAESTHLKGCPHTFVYI